MQISGPGQVHGPHGLQGPHGPRPKASPAGEAASRSATIDKVEISAEASRAADAGEVRAEKVAKIRAEIASGGYETPDKLDQAIDRLLDEIG